MTETPPSSAAPAAYSRGYLIWAMGLLLVVYASNFVDRTILQVLQQPIKEELKLSDAQLGLLGGFAFAVLYSTLGVPLARLAERRSRKGLITVSLVVWSAMTALCGAASGYAALFACRVGVGVGEAGASPPAHSLIADYFPPRRRATALSIYSLGIPIGVLVGSILGGFVAQHYGWRRAFMVVGLPGLVLAVLTQLTLKEPARGHSEGGEAADAALPRFGEVVAQLARRPAFLHVAAGASLTSFASYGIGAFAAPYFIRTFGVSLTQAGLALGLISGVSASIGTLGGGLVTDRLGRSDVRWYAWAPAISLAIAGPLYALGFLAPSWPLAVAILAVPPVFQYVYLGPSFGIMHNMVTPRMRATATALLFLAINFIGLGFGPTLVGLASDLFAARHFMAPAGNSGGFAALCPGGRPAPHAGAALALACRGASAYGVRWAIVGCTAIYLWAAAHYVAAGLRMRQDLDLDLSGPAR